MQPKTFTIFCIALFLASGIRSDYIYSNDHFLVFMDLQGKPAMVNIGHTTFDLHVSGKNVQMEMPVPQSGILFAKKSGNNNYTLVEDGDSIRFVEQGMPIKMGETEVDNPNSIGNAIQLINETDEQRTVYEFIRLIKFKDEGITPLSIRNLFFSNPEFFKQTVQNAYDSNPAVLADGSNELADLKFDPASATDTVTTLVDACVENYIKPVYLDYLKAQPESFEVMLETIQEVKEKFVGVINMDGYTPQLTRDIFIQKFNEMLQNSNEINLLISASLFPLRYNSSSIINFPMEVGEEHSEEDENARMMVTSNLMLFHLFQRFSEVMGSNIDNRQQALANQKIMVELRDEINEYLEKPSSQPEAAHSRLIKFFNNKLNAEQAEYLFWILTMKDQIDAYIVNYVKAVQASEHFMHLFADDTMISFSKIQKVLNYFDPDSARSGLAKYNMFTKARRNLILV